ncbi:MAG TPA: RNA polymerase sigma factor, partial [Tepidisphaeraceae bacterium]|nr:RNA polymerase sigma factor [Tepidisphaeraceae bacterium]
EPGSPSLDRLLRRDPDAFAWLVDEHQALVLMLGQSMGLFGMDLEDAAAETFSNVYRALPKFEARSSLRSWIYRIALRTFAHFRRRRRRQATVALPEELHDRGQVSPDQHLAEVETNERIWALVARLDAREAAAVELHYRQGWSLDEIADTLECPVGTVKTLLFRGRQRLREAIGGKESEL